MTTSTEPSEFLYKIMIEGLPMELENMRPGGIYWLNMTQWDDCTLVTRLIVGAAAAQMRGALVGTKDTSWAQDKLKEAASSHDLRIVKPIEGTMAALNALPTNLDRAIRPKQRTLLLMLPNVVLGQFDRTVFRSLLSKWRDWLVENECAILVLHHSTDTQELTRSMIPDNDMLAGLVSVKREDSRSLTYNCVFWSTAIGVVASRNYMLEQRGDELYVTGTTDHASAAFPKSSHRRYIVERDALSGFSQIREKFWEQFDSQEAVYEVARTETDATIVFVLRTHAQLQELARILHSLRLERGPTLRLVVRELSSQLRYQDEQKLLDCGASLVIGGHLNYTRFRSLLESIQTVRYTRKLVNTPDALFTSALNGGALGVVPPSQFIRHIRTTLQALEKTQTPAVMVMMRPVPNLNIELAIKQLNLRRFEDIACTLGGDIYLFLHGCLPELVQEVLTQLFRLPFDEIFSDHTTYEDRSSIQLALEKMQTQMKAEVESPRKMTNTVISAESLDDAFILSQKPEAICYNPKRIKLRLD